MTKLSPGATIGIIGGGQLGRMLAMAAARFGLKTCILEPEVDCPAAQVANRHLKFSYHDREGLAALAKACDVITYEFENVPVESARFLEQRTTLRPSSRALEVSQDRLLEKNFLKDCGAITTGFYNVESSTDLIEALNSFNGTGILKTRRLGYDGKGQIRFDGTNNPTPEEAMLELDNVASILEEIVPFEREISIIAARGIDGKFAAYEPAENTHREGILRTSVIPAAINSETGEKAVEIAEAVLKKLDYVGVMGIEFFVLDDGRLLVNEMAPRVHNSGHWTEAACTISQFEQHIRAIAGWPLGPTTRHADCIMENLVGDDATNAHMIKADLPQLLHLYGKSEIRAGRKMGHITRLTAL